MSRCRWCGMEFFAGVLDQDTHSPRCMSRLDALVKLAAGYAAGEPGRDASVTAARARELLKELERDA